MSRRLRSISRLRPKRFALTVCGALLGVARVFALDEEPGKVFEAIQQQVNAVCERQGGAVVRIEATDVRGRLSGTGFFIDPNGTLYTSYSVGGESQDITVHFRGALHPATRLISDLRSGIAVLKIDAETPFLTFGKASELAKASPVMKIGRASWRERV